MSVGEINFKGLNLKFQLNQSNCLDINCRALPLLHSVSPVLVTITLHIFSDIFPREYFLAIKKVNDKNMRHLIDTKIY